MAVMSLTPCIFNAPAFREILASEFALKDTLLNLETPNQQKITLPAFIRQNFWQKPTLVIGAGFDKTGEDPSLSQLHIDDYIEALLTDSKTQDFQHIEFRTKHQLHGHKDYSDKVELGIQLNAGKDALWSQLSRNTRKNLSRSLKLDFHYEVGNSKQHLDIFYGLYQQSIHSLGSLAHKKAFFTQLVEECSEHIAIFIGYLGKKPVVASFNFISNDEVYGAWSGFSPEAKKHNVFLTMLWSITEYAIEQGCQTYNLGRSSLNSNQYQFKKKLANYEKKIYYYRLQPYQTKPSQSRAMQLIAQIIKRSPPQLMRALSHQFLHRFY